MKTIAFYLPQYHPIPENNEWWGKGFTDWVNVAAARPLYKGHHQPQIPADLGFYDLRLEETRVAQAELATKFGVGGFCYYHYWFNGKILLGRPFEEVLTSGRPDFPFCLCWANENWTRRWDGKERSMLMTQDYDTYSPEAHMEWLTQPFADARYIRVDNRPLFLVYNPSHIPNLEAVVKRWKESAVVNGVAEPYLCAVSSFQNTLSPTNAQAVGFDAQVEFYPSHQMRGLPSVKSLSLYGLPTVWNRVLDRLGFRSPALRAATHTEFSYSKMVDNILSQPEPTWMNFPCVIPSWDNSARRRSGATVIQNDDPELYRHWLSTALQKVSNRPDDQQIVFINAWNEWGEGCHLEPDLRNGHRLLEATKAAMDDYLT